MPKGGLTGGTGDVNPQWYRTTIAPALTVTTTSGAGISTSQAFPVPINRLNQKSGSVTVMEILKCRWYQTTTFTVASPIDMIASMFSTLTTRAPASFGANIIPFAAGNPAIIDLNGISNAVTIGGSILDLYSVDNSQPDWSDLTDGDGHGILVATDNIYLNSYLSVVSIAAGSMTAVGNCNCDILYRFKNVSLQEYIGIVQSQQ